MTVARTTLLDLPIITTGTESGLWGDYTNNGLTQYLDIAIAGMSNLTSANFTAGALTIETTEGTDVATNISATSAQYAGFRVTSLATNSTITVGNTGTNPSRSYRLINADSTYTLTFKATGQTGVTLQPGQSAVVAFNGTDYVFVGAAGPVLLTTPLTVVGNATAGAEIRLPEDTDNGSNYVAIKAPDNIASNATLTAPAVTDTLATIGTAQTFTAAQTFRSANAIRSEAASTQDAVVLAGRAGGTSSYAVTLTPTTLSDNRTLTLPDASGTILQSGTAVTVAQGGTGITSGTSGGIPYFSSTSAIASSGLLSANQFVIGGGAGASPTSTTSITWANSFTGANTFYNSTGQTFGTATSTQDGFVIGGRAGGSSSYRITFTPGTLSASRTVTFPDGGGNYTLGYLNIPAVGTKTGSYTLAIGDVGKYVQVGSGGSITLPTSVFAEGDAIAIYNNTTGNITITCSAPTTYIAGTDTVKTSMTLATRGFASVFYYSATACVVSGNVS